MVYERGAGGGAASASRLVIAARSFASSRSRFSSALSVLACAPSYPWTGHGFYCYHLLVFYSLEFNICFLQLFENKIWTDFGCVSTDLCD